MARVLLLGATGFLGHAVAPAIADAGHQLRVLVRNQARLPDLAGRRVDIRIGDALDAQTLRDACQGIEHVVDLVAVRRDHPQPLVDVNVDHPRLLAEAARSAGVQGVVFVSAIGSALNPRRRYLSSRWMGEEELRQSGVPTSVLRFSFILGEDGGLLIDFERAAGFGPVLVIPGSGQTRLQPIVKDDAARCVALAIGRPDLVGSSVDLGGPEVMTYETLFNLFLKARGIRKPRTKIPAGLLMPAAYIMEALLANPVVVPDELRTIQHDSLAQSLDCVLTYFGFRPLSPSLWAAEHWRKTAPQAALH